MAFEVKIYITGLIALVRMRHGNAEVGLCALLVNQPRSQGDPIPAHYPRFGWGGQRGYPTKRENYWNLHRERLTLSWVGSNASATYVAPTFSLVPKLEDILPASPVLRPECLRSDSLVPDEVAAQFVIQQGELGPEQAATACYKDNLVVEVEVEFEFRPQFSMPGTYPSMKVADLLCWEIEAPDDATALEVTSTHLDETNVTRRVPVAPKNNVVEVSLSNSPAEGSSRCAMRKGGTVNTHFRRYEDFLKNPEIPAHHRRVPRSPLKKPSGVSEPKDPSPANRPMCPPVEI